MKAILKEAAVSQSLHLGGKSEENHKKFLPG
jgi:hypothetical protein